MLGGDHDSVQAQGLPVLSIFHSHLGLSVRPQAVDQSVPSGQGKGYGQAVGQDNRQRKHFRCFVTRIADHHALIPGSKLRYGIFLSAISSLLQRAVYTGRDIRALLVNQALDGKLGRIISHCG